MRILFTKLPGHRFEVEVRERRGPDLRLPAREVGPTLPHELVHAAVERALGLDDGFWSAIERGAMFEGFELVHEGRHKRAGIRDLERLLETTLPAEMAVSWAHRVWSGQRSSGRGLGACPLSEAELSRAAVALDEAKARWDTLAVGETLVWSW